MPIQKVDGIWQWVDQDLTEKWDGNEWSKDYIDLKKYSDENGLNWQLIPTRHTNHPIRKQAREKAIEQSKILLEKILPKKELAAFKIWMIEILSNGQKIKKFHYFENTWIKLSRNPRKGKTPSFNVSLEIKKLM